MSDQQLISSAQAEVWNVDRQIKDLNEKECNAAMHLCRSVKWLDAQPQRAKQLATAQAAERNFRELAMMALHLEEAYAGNATALVENAGDSEHLRKINIWLSWCYFMVGLSKIMDAIAQFYGGPYAKLITDLKTPLTDIGKEAMKNFSGPHKSNPRLDMTLTIPQTVNTTMMCLGAIPDPQDLPAGKDLIALQKGLGAIIDLVKDVSELIKAPKEMKEIMADAKLMLVKFGEKEAKLLDLVNKLITLYQSGVKLGTRMAPDSITDRLPEKMKSAAFDKKLDTVKKYLSAAKYLLEAWVNFSQCGLSLFEVSDDWSARNGSLALAGQQLTATGGGAFSPDMQMFANATQSDLIKIIHSVNSAPDAHQMGHIALLKLKELKVEIERLNNNTRNRNGYWLELDVQNIDQMKAKLRDADKKLEDFRQKLEGGPEARTYQVTELLPRMDEARNKIARILAPPVPAWIAPRGRFGPRIGPQ